MRCFTHVSHAFHQGFPDARARFCYNRDRRLTTSPRTSLRPALPPQGEFAARASSAGDSVETVTFWEQSRGRRRGFKERVEIDEQLAHDGNDSEIEGCHRCRAADVQTEA